MNFLKMVYRGWLKFGELLGTINGFVILTAFYFVIIGLYALPTKLFKKIKIRKITVDSYWKNKNHLTNSEESIKYQF